MHYLAAYLILHSVAFAADSKPGLYDGAQVWRSSMRTPSDIMFIQQLMNRQDLSVWHLSPDEAVFLVQPEHKLKVNRLLSTQGLEHSVVIMDVQRHIDEQRLDEPLWDMRALRRGHRMNWSEYPTLEVINEYLNYIAKQYPSICKLEVIGYSAENRSIKMMKVSNGNPSNKGFLLVSGQHAREWMAITSALFIMREIVTKFDSQPSFIQDKDWYIIPLTNPDGYQYTRTVDRLWRKNRRRIHKCYGVDLNRNFGKNFNMAGITDFNECKDVYSGPHAFSEPESKALRNVTLKLKNRLSAMVDLHTFGQLILFPWASLSQRTSDFDVHNATAAGMLKAISEFQNRRYSFGPTYHLIYPASGSLLDWCHASGVLHSYVVEGRDRGQHGFLTPPHYVQEAGREMLVAVKHVAKVITITNINKTQSKQHRLRWF